MKNLILTALLFVATTFSAIAQDIPMNKFTVDGKTYKFNGKEPMTYTEKKGEWWLMGNFVGSNKEAVAIAVRTKGKMLPSGNYPTTPNVGKIPEGKVAYSISISTDNMSFGMLSYKQFTSTDNGTAVISNEDGIYSIGIGV